MNTATLFFGYFVFIVLWALVGLTFVVDMLRHIEVRTRGVFIMEIIGCILGPLVAIPLLIYSFGALVWIDLKADLPTIKRWWNYPLDDKDKVVYENANPLPTVNTLYLSSKSEYEAEMQCEKVFAECAMNKTADEWSDTESPCSDAYDACIAKIRGKVL